MAEWLSETGHGFDQRIAIKVDGILSGNDGDVTLSFILHELLQYHKEPICVDIGADKGWVSVFCAKYKPNARILAFEPTPDGFKELTKHTQAYPSITCHNVAISDCSGSLPFHINGSDSHSRTDPNAFFPCNRLQHFVDDTTILHFVKIDTEGHESIILTSIESMLPRIGSLVLEFTTYWYGQTKEDCVQTSFSLLTMLSRHFEHIYMLSRRWPPVLYGPVVPDEFRKTIETLYERRLQIDILVSKIPIQTIPISPFIHSVPSVPHPNA